MVRLRNRRRFESGMSISVCQFERARKGFRSGEAPESHAPIDPWIAHQLSATGEPHAIREITTGS